MNEADSLFVDCDEQKFWIVRICRLFDFEKRGPEGCPPEDDLQEGDLGVLGAHVGIFVERFQDFAFPIGSRLLLNLKRTKC
jgi:hypothetical protein